MPSGPITGPLILDWRCSRCRSGHGDDHRNPQSWAATPSFALDLLDGTNGFELIGGNSGVSLSPAGDLNKDGFGDNIIGGLALGAPEGQSYVIFGGNLGSATVQASAQAQLPEQEVIMGSG